MSGPENAGEFVSGNVFIRKIRYPAAGGVTHGHRHNFDHTTLFLKGTVRVRLVEPSGIAHEITVVAPDHMLVRAEVEHEITSLTDDVEFWCVYSHRDAQGNVVQEPEAGSAEAQRRCYV